MDLFSAYELYDEFTLHDVSYLLLGHLPLPPGPLARDDPHLIIWHQADTLGGQLINDAKTGKLRATHKDSDSWVLAGAPEWAVKRNDLKDWAKRKMIRPAFLFPQLPPLNTVRNVAAAEAYRVGTQSHVFELEYRCALLGIVQQINNGQRVAYVLGSDGEFDKLRSEDALVFAMRSFLAEGVKSEEHLQDGRENGLTVAKIAAGNLVSTNMDWADRIHIPAEYTSVAEPPTASKDARRVESIQGEANQDGGPKRDILAPLIEKAIKDAGSKDLQQVFLKLRELALQSESPFTGEIDGNALCYTNSENKLDKFTKAALSKRLQRRRAAEDNKSL